MPRVAAVQLEASHLDPEAGLRRIEEWARKAASEGAEVIVFPELLVPGYPRYVPDPFPPSAEGTAAWEEAVAYHRRYVEGSQVIPGPFTDALGEIARAVGATLVVGVSEKDPRSVAASGTPAS
jgi:predicted amidohydrolase